MPFTSTVCRSSLNSTVHIERQLPLLQQNMKSMVTEQLKTSLIHLSYKKRIYFGLSIYLQPIFSYEFQSSFKESRIQAKFWIRLSIGGTVHGSKSR